RRGGSRGTPRLRGRERSSRGQRRSADRQPVDAADPALAVGGVPVDRPRHALLPGDLWLPAGLAIELLVADAQREHVARAGPEAIGGADDLALGPVPLLLADAKDQTSPVSHRDVL